MIHHQPESRRRTQGPTLGKQNGAEQFLQLQDTLKGALSPELCLKLGLEEPVLPVDVEEETEPARAESGWNVME